MQRKYTPKRNLDVTTMRPERVDVLLGEWKFREDRFGDVRGWCEDGRRTGLKRSYGKHSALQLAQDDALNGRLVCQEWPNCAHTSVEGCSGMWE